VQLKNIHVKASTVQVEPPRSQQQFIKFRDKLADVMVSCQTPRPPKLHGCFSEGSHAQKMTSVLDIKKRNCNNANFGMSQKKIGGQNIQN